MARLAKLLVIDNEVNDPRHAAFILQTSLSRENLSCMWVVTVEKDCFDGLRQLFITSFDAIIVSGNVAEFSAIDFLHTIRAYGHATPVTLLLSRREVCPSSALQAQQAGFNSLLISPFTPADLTAIINRKVEKKRSYHSKDAFIPSMIAPGSPTSTTYSTEAFEDTTLRNCKQRRNSLSPFQFDDDLMDLLNDL